MGKGYRMELKETLVAERKILQERRLHLVCLTFHAFSYIALS